MSAVLTPRQELALLGAAHAQHHVLVAPVWLVARLTVVVDARAEGLLIELCRQTATELADLVGPAALGLTTGSCHSRARAGSTLAEMRHHLTHGRDTHGWQLVLQDPRALDAAADHLAAHPHGALVVATVSANGPALAARWS